jgi:polar amino acid transport system permease protein
MAKGSRLLSPAKEGSIELEKIPGSESSSRIDAWWWLVALAAGIFILMVTLRPDPYWRIVLYVRDGVWVTVYVTVLSFVFTLVAGLIGALGRISKNPIISGVATLYVELIRGIPLLVQLLWWYFAFPAVIRNFGASANIPYLANYDANASLMAIFGLTMCYGAYMTEIYRAGIQSIPGGQMEAARSLGMNYIQSMRFVILPQAIRVILPPVGNEFISLLKDSSLVSAVAVADLTRRGREFIATTFDPINTWNMIAIIYLLMTLFSARVVARIEKSTKVER